MRGLILLLALVNGQAPSDETPSTPLSNCQKCCSSGGDCSKASHGQPGKCCGQVQGQWYCCPDMTSEGPAKCGHCANSYRCFTGIRPPSRMCANDGGNGGSSGGGLGTTEPVVSSFVGLLCFMLLAYTVVTCMRRQAYPRPAVPIMHQHSGIAMNSVPCPGVPMAQPGQPVAPGTAVGGVPVATAYPAGRVGAYPAAPVAAYPQYGPGYAPGCTRHPSPPREPAWCPWFAAQVEPAGA